eukprot:gene5462-12439_t
MLRGHIGAIGTVTEVDTRAPASATVRMRKLSVRVPMRFLRAQPQTQAGTGAATLQQAAPGVRLPEQQQAAAECLTSAVNHALMTVVPADRLPRWRQAYQLVANEMDVDDHQLEKDMGDDGKDAYRAVPHSDPSGNMLSGVGIRTTNRCFPWTKWEPAGRAEGGGPGWLPVCAVLRHWGSRSDGHFVCEREHAPGQYQLVNSHASVGPPTALIRDWEESLQRNVDRKWRLWRRDPAALAGMPEAELRDLARQLVESARLMQIWDLQWASTTEVLDATAAAPERPIEDIRRWVVEELRTKLAWRPPGWPDPAAVDCGEKDRDARFDQFEACVGSGVAVAAATAPLAARNSFITKPQNAGAPAADAMAIASAALPAAMVAGGGAALVPPPDLENEKPKQTPPKAAAVAAMSRDGAEKRRDASAAARQRRRTEQVDAL